MTVTGLISFALVCVVLLVVLKKYASHFSVLAEVAVIIVFILSVLPEIKNLLSVCNDIYNMSSIESDIFKTMLKAFAILTIGNIASDICRDNGENAIAGVLDVAVKVLAVFSVMPIFTTVLVTAFTLLEQ